MDRNSAIGLTLIAALLMAYFYWFGTPPTPPAEEQMAIEQPVQPEVGQPADSLMITVPDSTAATAAFGSLSAFANGSETPYKVETDDMIVTFSSKGGVIKELELKHFKTYQQGPLKLINPSNTKSESPPTKAMELPLRRLV